MSMGGFDLTRKRPLAAHPRKHGSADSRPQCMALDLRSLDKEQPCQKVTRTVPTKLFCVTGFGVTATGSQRRRSD